MSVLEVLAYIMTNITARPIRLSTIEWMSVLMFVMAPYDKYHSSSHQTIYNLSNVCLDVRNGSYSIYIQMQYLYSLNITIKYKSSGIIMLAISNILCHQAKKNLWCLWLDKIKLLPSVLGVVSCSLCVLPPMSLHA